ncbi:MAG: AraC family transcriptional regulator [Hyphomonas sp.]|uniref:helix-turn-helix domain-containing protein n=1 Tax=Hyphomonas sp. TaxID=87 RepID=UPI0035283C0B
MLEGLSFGWLTAVLSVAVLQLLVIAGALQWPITNKSANRTLAALLIVLAGILTPWMIGFAGFYDKWRWLSFAPFSITLVVAPLFYLYIHALVHDRLPQAWWRHLVPAGVQLAYLTGAFLLLRQPFKNEWMMLSGPAYDGLVSAGIIIGFAAYGLASLRLLSAYRTSLAGQRSDDHRFAVRWLSNSTIALMILFPFWATYSLWDLVAPLGYRGLMGLYVGIAVFSLYLAVEGWRHSALAFPRLESLPDETVASPAGPDWAQLGAEWAARVRAEKWYREPELSLAGLARLLGTNSGYLSRALNDGLGVNFSTFINQMRCEDVAGAIGAGRSGDLLGLALDAGFSSKASFNRSFKAAFGVSPSAYRQKQVSDPEK